MPPPYFPRPPWGDIWSGFIEGGGPRSPFGSHQPIWPGITNEEGEGLFQQKALAWPLQGFEEAHQRTAVPGMEPFAAGGQFLPGTTRQELADPWTVRNPITRGSIDIPFTGHRDPNAFRQYVDPQDAERELYGLPSPTGFETKFNPAAALKTFTDMASPLGTFAKGIGSEALNIQPFEPETVRQQRIDAEAKHRELDTGNRVTQKERRHISQDMYPMPPLMLGAIEEAPWFAIPATKGLRADLYAARTGPTLSRLAASGRAGQIAAPAARAAIKTAEVALKPLQVVETAAEKSLGYAIKPFMWPIRPILRGRAEAVVQEAIDQINDRLRQKPGPTSLDPDQVGAALPEELIPEEGFGSVEAAVDATNRMLYNRLGIEEKLVKAGPNKTVIRDKSVKMPTTKQINERHQYFDNAFERMFPRLTAREIAEKFRSQDLIPPQLYDTDTGRALTPEEVRRTRIDPNDNTVADVNEEVTEYPELPPEIQEILAESDSWTPEEIANLYDEFVPHDVTPEGLRAIPIEEGQTWEEPWSTVNRDDWETDLILQENGINPSTIDDFTYARTQMDRLMRWGNTPEGYDSLKPWERDLLDDYNAEASALAERQNLDVESLTPEEKDRMLETAIETRYQGQFDNVDKEDWEEVITRARRIFNELGDQGNYYDAYRDITYSLGDAEARLFSEEIGRLRALEARRRMSIEEGMFGEELPEIAFDPAFHVNQNELDPRRPNEPLVLFDRGVGEDGTISRVRSNTLGDSNPTFGIQVLSTNRNRWKQVKLGDRFYVRKVPVIEGQEYDRVYVLDLDDPTTPSTVLEGIYQGSPTVARPLQSNAAATRALDSLLADLSPYRDDAGNYVRHTSLSLGTFRNAWNKLLEPKSRRELQSAGILSQIGIFPSGIPSKRSVIAAISDSLRGQGIKIVRDRKRSGTDYLILDSRAVEKISKISVQDYKTQNMRTPRLNAQTEANLYNATNTDNFYDSAIDVAQTGRLRIDMSELQIGMSKSGKYTIHESLESRNINNGQPVDYGSRPSADPNVEDPPTGIYNLDNRQGFEELRYVYEIRDVATGKKVWEFSAVALDPGMVGGPVRSVAGTAMRRALPGTDLNRTERILKWLDDRGYRDSSIPIRQNEVFIVDMHTTVSPTTFLASDKYRNAAMQNSLTSDELGSITAVLADHLELTNGTKPIIFMGGRVTGTRGQAGPGRGGNQFINVQQVTERADRVADNNVHLDERARGGVGAGAEHQAVEDVARSGTLNRNIETMADVDQIVLETKNLSPGAADFYIKLMFSLHDSTFALRVLQDNYFRSISPHAAFRPGSHRDVVAGVILSSGAPIRGMRFYEHFIRTKIEPLLGDGVEQWHMERVLQARHWLDIERTIGRENMPRVTDPLDTTGEIDIGDDWKQWIDNLERDLTPDQFDRVVKGAEEVRDVYARMRQELLDEGIISKEQFTAMVDNYPWYNPIDYHEYMDNSVIARNMPIVNDGIFKFVKDADVSKFMATPPLGETLARRLISHELRLHRNRVTKAFVDIGRRSNIGLVDISDNLEEMGIRSARDMYDDRYTKTGYLSYYEDGQRYVFGMKDATRNKTTYVDKIWWDAVNGRSGLGIHGSGEVSNILAATNSFFKATYTTWDPLFMIGNGLIDQLVVALKYRILPTSVWLRLTQSLFRQMPLIKNRQGTAQLDLMGFLTGKPGSFQIGSEDRIKELMQFTGAYQNLIYDSRQVTASIQRQLQRSGHVGATVIPDTLAGSTRARAIADALQEGIHKYYPVPKIGEYVEQAPRLLVGEKTLKRLLGKAEYNRLMRLSRADWEEELFRNYNKTGTGLIDTPEARQASINALESTINFFRGGDAIRRWNNYFMFLNAAFEGAKLPFRMMGVDVHPYIKVIEDATVDGPKFEFGKWSEKSQGMTGKYDQVLGDIDINIGKFRFNKRVDQRLAAATTVGTAMTAYTGLQLGWNFQYDEYWDIPTSIRHNALIFMLPPEKDEFGNTILGLNGRPQPNYIVIPHRLRELSLFFGTTTHLLETAFTENPTEWTLFAKNIWKSSSPINDLPLPQVASIAGEQISGFDFYRMDHIVPDELRDGEPGENYDTYTSETARVIANFNANYQWMPEVTQSPMRLEHTYENLTGGIGTRVNDGTSYAILLLEDLRKNADRPMRDHVKEYRKMDTVQRNEFETSLTGEEWEEFQKELRKPYTDLEGNMLEKAVATAWDATGVEQRFGPDRGGGIYEMQKRSAEDQTGLSAEQTGLLRTHLDKLERDVLNRQQADDKALDSYMSGGEGISPTEWKENRKLRWTELEGAKALGDLVFPQSVQGKDPEIKQEWYDALYTAGGRTPDSRSQTQLLVAGYYNIPSPDTDPSVTWPEYFDNRRDYLNNIQARAQAEGDLTPYMEVNRYLDKNETPQERSYNDAMMSLRPYWDVGKDPTTLISDLTPELIQAWTRYLASNSDERRRLLQEYPQLQAILNARTRARGVIVWQNYQENGWGIMDSTLASWDPNYSPMTPDGKTMHDKIWGSRLPLSPTAR